MLVSNCKGIVYRIHLLTTRSAFGVLTDLVLALMPIPMLYKLQVNWKVKVALCCILSLGLLYGNSPLTHLVTSLSLTAFQRCIGSCRQDLLHRKFRKSRRLSMGLDRIDNLDDRRDLRRHHSSIHTMPETTIQERLPRFVVRKYISSTIAVRIHAAHKQQEEYATKSEQC